MAEGVNKFVSWTLDIVKEIKEIPVVAASVSRQRPLRPRSTLPGAPDGMVWEVDEVKRQWRLVPEGEGGNNGEDDRLADRDGREGRVEDRKDESKKDIKQKKADDSVVTQKLQVEEKVRSETGEVSSVENVKVKVDGSDHDQSAGILSNEHVTEDGLAAQNMTCKTHDHTDEYEHQKPQREIQEKQEAHPKNDPESEAIPKDDLTSSNEDADQFDTTNTASSHLPIHDYFNDETSEEKTETDNEIASILGSNSNNCSNSVSGVSISATTDDQWEIISERSGSAVLISFSGSVSGASFRSVSPSLAACANKFVLTELSAGEKYIEHVVLPTDTLQGICVAYKISATRLRMENGGFSGNNLQMAPKKLKIPIIFPGMKGNTAKPSTKGMMIRMQDKTRKEFKLYAFLAEMTNMELVEAKAYLDLSNWDLEEALRSAREEDCGFSYDGEAYGVDFVSSSPVLGAVARPKSLTAQDILSAPPPYEGHGFEMKDIKHRFPTDKS